MSYKQGEVLSKWFSWDEAVGSATADRLGIVNLPDPLTEETIKVTGRCADEVREYLGYPMVVHSWLRVKALEKVLCQRDFSVWCARRGAVANEEAWELYFAAKAHPKGWAVDFTCPKLGGPKKVVEVLHRSSIMFDQLIQECADSPTGGWVHISFDPKARGQVLVFNGSTYQELV